MFRICKFVGLALAALGFGILAATILPSWLMVGIMGVVILLVGLFLLF
jgi:membrane-bound ClpP family serine protease